MTIVLFMIMLTIYPLVGAMTYPIYKRLGGHKSFETYISQL